MRMFLSLALVLFFAFLSAYLAKRRGRDPVAWFMLGLLLGVFAPILLMILKPLDGSSKSSLFDDTEENEDVILTHPEERLGKEYLDKDWFYMDQEHAQQGPVSFSSLRPLWVEERITPLTYVWTEGMDNWKRIRELAGFEETLLS